MTSFLARLYAFKFFDSFILIVPLYAVMFVDAGLRLCRSRRPDRLVGDRLHLADSLRRHRRSLVGRHILALAQLARAGVRGLAALPTLLGVSGRPGALGIKSAFTSGTFEPCSMTS